MLVALMILGSVVLIGLAVLVGLAVDSASLAEGWYRLARARREHSEHVQELLAQERELRWRELEVDRRQSQLDDRERRLRGEDDL
jgi:hypothetical protein